MALPPHKLDDVFENIDTAETAFMADDDVKEAFAKAKAEYYETKSTQDANPGIVGSSPSQAARAAFLQTLNDSPRG